MKTKPRQVCAVQYFEDKKKRPVKAVTTYRPEGRRVVEFQVFSVSGYGKRAQA